MNIGTEFSKRTENNANRYLTIGVIEILISLST
jgi:hypothetical protein